MSSQSLNSIEKNLKFSYGGFLLKEGRRFCEEKYYEIQIRIEDDCDRFTKGCDTLYICRHGLVFGKLSCSRVT